MFNRFDFEQQIMNVWMTADEIDLIFEFVCDSDLSKDELANVLLGLAQLHNMKCNKLFNMFEEGVKNGSIG